MVTNFSSISAAKSKKNSDSESGHRQVFQELVPARLDKEGEKWAQRTLKQMTLEEKVGQMFMVWSRAQFLNVNSPDYLRLREVIRKYNIGLFGVTVRYEDGFLYKNEPLEAAMVTNNLQKESKLPLIFAADFEYGLGMRLHDVSYFPHAMAFGATQNADYVRQFGEIVAQEARAVGIQWNWFPDADVNSNPVNPIINTRSFGEDPQEVSRMVTAYIEGAHKYGMLTTAKHFPGHGDTSIDSHLAVPQIASDTDHLNRIELPRFEAAIKAGGDTIMVGHIVVPALDPDPNHVATISPAIVTGVLKQRLGFKGLVVTDALDMNGLTKLFPPGAAGAAQAAVQALQAGNDVLLLPSDLDGAYNGVLQAVHSGVIPESRIDESVIKILRLKASLGLHKARLVDVEKVNQIVARPENVAKGQQIADSAVTLIRDNHKVLPFRRSPKGTNPSPFTYGNVVETTNKTVVLIFTDDTRLESGRIFDGQIRARIPEAHVFYIDPRNAIGLTQPVMEAVQQAERVVAAVYAIPVAGRVAAAGNAAGPTVADSASAVLLKLVLQSAADRTVVAAMGNPYLASQIPGVQNYFCTYSNVSVSEVSAVKAIFGEIPMNGRLPVTIPNIASRGTGLSNSKPVLGGGTQ
jgi:beta-N-acetylhexosaminidase